MEFIGGIIVFVIVIIVIGAIGTAIRDNSVRKQAIEDAEWMSRSEYWNTYKKESPKVFSAGELVQTQRQDWVNRYDDSEPIVIDYNDPITKKALKVLKKNYPGL